MNFNFLSFLVSWIFPTKIDRNNFRLLCNEIEQRKLCKKIHSNYKKVQKKLLKKQKLKVIFLINEKSKWKCQNLYNLMLNNDYFEPLIVLTIADIQTKLSKDERQRILNDNIKYFESKNMKAELAYDIENDKSLDLNIFNPDIVFYQQPYLIDNKQDIEHISKYALTYYVPYYCPDYIDWELDCEHYFHQNLFRFIVLNQEVEHCYKNHLEKIGRYNENIKSLGHTVLDDYYLNKNYKPTHDYVIYAPHWSITDKRNNNIINLSTFDETGRAILQYAQHHPEIEWVFKPHPNLKIALKRIGWSEEDIDNYYREWEKIALCCYDSEYMDLFFNSKAMITDSGSFLMEYLYSGKPLIRLVSKHNLYALYPPMNEFANSFYNIYDFEKMYSVFDDLLVNKNDYKKEERIRLLNKYNYTGIYSSQNIIDDIMEVCKQN